MSEGAAELLRRAAESLDDARLLAEHRRRNEAVLTRLALHQALRAVSVAEGLEADETLRLDTLIKRVPSDHPQAALVQRLRDDAAQTIAAVAELVEALSRPKPPPMPRPGAPPAPQRDPKPMTRPEPDLSGPTALDSSPAGSGRADAVAGFPSAAFWTLMDRWQIGDVEALALIGHEGGLTKKRTRPRFRLQGAEATRYAALRALDQALEVLGLDPRLWLRAPQRPAPFEGASPLMLLQRDADVVRELLRVLHRQGLQSKLKDGS